MRLSVAAALAVIAVIVAGSLVYIYSGSIAGKPQAGYLLSITDPPQVPAGTSSLVLYYYSIAAHTTNSGWISANITGSVDLMRVLNSSQVLGSINLPNGSIVNQVRFNVSSASITINGTTYNVTVPSKSVTAHLVANSKVNSGSGALIDLSPVVVTIYTNSTSVPKDFVLVPSVIAISIGSRHVSLRAGEMEALNSSEREALDMLGSNISITGAALSASNGNVTDLLVTVRDNSNSSVDLHFIGVFGRENVVVNLSMFAAEANTILSRMAANASANSIGDFEDMMSRLNVTSAMLANLSTNSTLYNSLSARLAADLAQRTTEEGDFQENENMLPFLITANGTLAVPFASGEMNDNEDSPGFTLQPGQSHTFSFIGRITPASRYFTITPVAGANYRITVVGEEDARISTNVTAA